MTRLFVAALALASFQALAQELPEPVREALAKAGVPASAASVVVEAVAEGPILVSHQRWTPMNPASVMKLVTTYAALDLLGPAFTFHTDFLVQGTLADGVLEGNLHIRGGGDPKLTYDDLWRITHQLRSRGLREIRGDIVIDRGYFQPVAHDPARFDGEPRRAYNVGVDAFLVNYQAANFTFVPSASGVRVIPEPDFPNVQVISRIALTREPCRDWRRDIRYDFTETGLIATVEFTGSFSSLCNERTMALALLDGPRYAEAAFRWIWSETGGVLRGKVRSGPVPADATVLLRHDSEPLASLVRETNKFSNNVMARHVYLALSSELAGNGGEAKKSEEVVRAWLRKRAIDAPDFSIENGSGLSRTDRITAGTLAQLLRSAWSSPMMPELMGSMPLLAVDGTLKLRRVGGANGQAHLKGGTLTNVQSAAGYVLDALGRRWVVVMMVNHANAGATQPAIDALVEWVHRTPAPRAAK